MSNQPADNHNDPQKPREKPRRLRRFFFILFIVIIVVLGFAGGWLIRVYFNSGEPEGVTSSSRPSGPLADIKEQWREHRLPLDIKSLSKIWEDMRRDLETDKIPELKTKLEDLKAQVEEKKKDAQPELEAEWQKLSEKLDGLLQTVQEKRQDWAKQLTDVQDEAKQLLEKEAQSLSGDSSTPAPATTP